MVVPSRPGPPHRPGSPPDDQEAAPTPGTRADGRIERGNQTRRLILRRTVDVASVEGLEALSLGRLATELRLSKSGPGPRRRTPTRPGRALPAGTRPRPGHHPLALTVAALGREPEGRP
ncbi:hypothetical protein GCM10010251_43230 [Streptomyces aurantiogriseus]|uniref:Uncharacterized protein n=1 Tax=Streptomyces aurantiogriseus TaxID=66870 RepID=A0A918FCL2_9ACTN|nr:hypothetical protein GCM10010251_43230 [Streptomyces aurantiogriseus]